MNEPSQLKKIHIVALVASVVIVGMFFWSTLSTLAFNGPTANPPSGNGATFSDSSNNVYMGGNLNVSGTITSANNFSGSVSAGNVSAGQFGSNESGGNFYFPAKVGVGSTTAANLLDVDGSADVQGELAVGTTNTSTATLNVVGTLNVSATSTFATVSSTQICIAGSCNTTWPSGASGANPSASVGTSAVNGSATTFMRSDGAPAINQAATFSFSALGNTTSTANISAATFLASSSITNVGVKSALVLDSAAGLEGAYGGASVCANSGLVSAISAAGATTCVTSSTIRTNLGVSTSTATTTASTITLPTVIGSCTSSTVTIAGATSSTGAVFVSPVVYPGNGYIWQGYVSALNTVVIEVCAATSTTGTAAKFSAIYIN